MAAFGEMERSQCPAVRELYSYVIVALVDLEVETSSTALLCSV